MLRNVVEILAAQKLEELLKEEDCCKCAQCKEDMMAYALNRLAPHYVSTDVGQLFAKANELKWGYDFDLMKELSFALNVVRNNPRH